MNKKKLFKQLKNGNMIRMFHKSIFVDYTIQITFEHGVFSLYSYHFGGNDVFDESNYQHEQKEDFDNFDALLKRLIEKFPGVTYS